MHVPQAFAQGIEQAQRRRRDARAPWREGAAIEFRAAGFPCVRSFPGFLLFAPLAFFAFWSTFDLLTTRSVVHFESLNTTAEVDGVVSSISR